MGTNPESTTGRQSDTKEHMSTITSQGIPREELQKKKNTHPFQRIKFLTHGRTAVVRPIRSRCLCASTYLRIYIHVYVQLYMYIHVNDLFIKFYKYSYIYICMLIYKYESSHVVIIYNYSVMSQHYYIIV